MYNLKKTSVIFALLTAFNINGMKIENNNCDFYIKNTADITADNNAGSLLNTTTQFENNPLSLRKENSVNFIVPLNSNNVLSDGYISDEEVSDSGDELDKLSRVVQNNILSNDSDRTVKKINRRQTTDESFPKIQHYGTVKVKHTQRRLTADLSKIFYSNNETASSNEYVREQPNRNENNILNSSPLFYDNYIDRPLPRKIKVIISCDGGGSRGIILATFLHELHSRLFGNNAECWNHKLPVNMYAGTSVGALISVSEAFGITNYVYENFTEIARKIFHKNTWNSFLSFFTCKLCGLYESAGRLDVINELLGDKTADDLEVPVIIPMYSLNTRIPIIYNTNDPNHTMRIPLPDALMATSAAPTYFPPHIVKNKRETLTLIDGGVWQNNPAFIAYQEMRERYPEDVICVISFGTGHSSTVDNANDYPKTAIGWASRFVDVAMNGSSKASELALFNAKDYDNALQYYRFNVELEREDIITDNKNADYFNKLATITRHTIEETENQGRLFEEVVAILRDQLENNQE